MVEYLDLKSSSPTNLMVIVWLIPMIFGLLFFLGLAFPAKKSDTSNHFTDMILGFSILFLTCLPMGFFVWAALRDEKKLYFNNFELSYANMFDMRVGELIQFNQISAINTKYHAFSRGMKSASISSVKRYALSMVFKESNGERNIYIGTPYTTVQFQQKLVNRMRSLGYKITSKTAKIER